jgi:hypothetical protein
MNRQIDKIAVQVMTVVKIAGVSGEALDGGAAHSRIARSSCPARWHTIEAWSPP